MIHIEAIIDQLIVYCFQKRTEAGLVQRLQVIISCSVAPIKFGSVNIYVVIIVTSITALQYTLENITLESQKYSFIFNN